MATDPRMTQERIIQTKLREVIARSSKQHPIEFAVYFVVNKGDVVPERFRGLPNLKIDKKGVALASWEDAWCQSHWDKSNDWDNSWGECWDNSTSKPEMPSGIYDMRVNLRRVSLADFSAAERDTLARIGIHQ